METKNKKQDESRVVTNYERKKQMKSEAAAKAKKRKIAVRGTLIAIVAVVVALVAFATISTVGKNRAFIKVNGENISKDEFNFYYMRMVNYYGSMYSSYGQIDSSVSLDEQPYSNTMSWADYFEQLATEELVRVKALAEEAKKNDFDGDVDKAYESNTKILEEDAKENDMTADEYYNTMFGGSKSDVEEYLREYLLAELWYEKVEGEKTATEDEVEAYYADNKDDYDCVDYYVTAVTPAGINLETCTDEEYNTAMIAAHSKAESIVGSVEVTGELKECAVKNDMSDKLAEWLLSKDRVAGDRAVVDDNDNSTIYAVKFLNRYRDESPTVDIRAVITTSEDVTADAMLQEWEAGEKTEDSFVELVKKYTEDTNVSEGLYQGVTKYGMEIEELSKWMFDASRKEGDTTAVTSEDGYKYVVYFKNTNDPDYKFAIKEAVLNERMTAYVDDLMADVEVSDPYGNIKYLQLAGE